MDALLGYTGFVGQTLLRQRDFAAQFNSRNIAQSAGQSFDLAVCAAAPGSMFEANRFPERDTQVIDELCTSLAQIKARQFVLVSTIAVLDRFDGGADEGTAQFQETVAYGVNRRRLETFCAQHFDQCLIIRLPALFGAGLKKNFLFDLRNPVPSMLPEARFDLLSPAAQAFYALDERLGMRVLDRGGLEASGQRAAIGAEVLAAGLSAVGFTNPESRFQFYAMSQLWTDVQRALTAGLKVLHLAPEPVMAGDVHLALTGQKMAPNAARVHAEDMRTRHADLWQRSGCYNADAATVMAGLQGFSA